MPRIPGETRHERMERIERQIEQRGDALRWPIQRLSLDVAAFPAVDLLEQRSNRMHCRLTALMEARRVEWNAAHPKAAATYDSWCREDESRQAATAGLSSSSKHPHTRVSTKG